MEQAIDHVGDIIMPTPMAVLRMAELLATGVEGESGIGDTVVIDIGGATTDIHSATKGISKNPDIPMLGLEEPFAKRTVEGDLGLCKCTVSHGCLQTLYTLAPPRFTGNTADGRSCNKSRVLV